MVITLALATVTYYLQYFNMLPTRLPMSSNRSCHTAVRVVFLKWKSNLSLQCFKTLSDFHFLTNPVSSHNLSDHCHLSLPTSHHFLLLAQVPEGGLLPVLQGLCVLLSLLCLPNYHCSYLEQSSTFPVTYSYVPGFIVSLSGSPLHVSYFSEIRSVVVCLLYLSMSYVRIGTTVILFILEFWSLPSLKE